MSRNYCLYKTESQRTPLPLPPCEATAKTQPSVTQEVGAHQTLDLLVSCSWISQNSEKYLQVTGLWYFVIAT